MPPKKLTYDEVLLRITALQVSLANYRAGMTTPPGFVYKEVTAELLKLKRGLAVRKDRPKKAGGGDGSAD